MVRDETWLAKEPCAHHAAQTDRQALLSNLAHVGAGSLHPGALLSRDDAQGCGHQPAVRDHAQRPVGARVGAGECFTCVPHDTIDLVRVRHPVPRRFKGDNFVEVTFANKVQERIPTEGLRVEEILGRINAVAEQMDMEEVRWSLYYLGGGGR